MSLIYFALTLCLLLATSLLAVPFFDGHVFKRKSFLLIGSLFISFALLLYLFLNQNIAIKQWLTHGKKHYELLIAYNQLGGIDGIIHKIQQKLDKNPSDAEGWLILSKLYQSKGDKISAAAAFKKSQLLQKR